MRSYLIQQSREKKRSTSIKRIKSGKKEKRPRGEESKEERKSRRDAKKIKLGLIPSTTSSSQRRTEDSRHTTSRRPAVEEGKSRAPNSESKGFSGDSRRIGGVREKAEDSYSVDLSSCRTDDPRDSQRRDDARDEDRSRRQDYRDEDRSRRQDYRDEDRSRRDDRKDDEAKSTRDGVGRRSEERSGKKSNFADLEKWAKGA